MELKEYLRALCNLEKERYFLQQLLAKEEQKGADCIKEVGEARAKYKEHVEKELPFRNCVSR